MGKILGGQKEFGKFEFISREFNQEIPYPSHDHAHRRPARQVRVRGNLPRSDRGKSAKLELPFEIKG